MIATIALLAALVPLWYQSVCIDTGFIPRPQPDVQCVGNLERNVLESWREIPEGSGIFFLIRVDVVYGTTVNKAVDCVVDYDFIPNQKYSTALCNGYNAQQSGNPHWQGCFDPDRNKLYSHHGHMGQDSIHAGQKLIDDFTCKTPGFPNGNPEDQSCRWWFGLGPDFGACEYIPPPSAPQQFRGEVE